MFLYKYILQVAAVITGTESKQSHMALFTNKQFHVALFTNIGIDPDTLLVHEADCLLCLIEVDIMFFYELISTENWILCFSSFSLSTCQARNLFVHCHRDWYVHMVYRRVSCMSHKGSSVP